MKTASALTLASFLWLTTPCLASDWHDFDRGLESSLRATLNDKHVHVHAKKGIVTLDGEVRTEMERERIDSLVRNTSGVVAVKDELKVSEPSPGLYAGRPTSIPVYGAAPVEVIPSTPVVTMPAPVIVPNYPKVRVQAWTEEDEPAARRIAEQLREDAVPSTGYDNVVITVRHGNVSLRGALSSPEDRRALIAAVQRAEGLRAIYDELQVR